MADFAYGHISGGCVMRFQGAQYKEQKRGKNILPGLFVVTLLFVATLFSFAHVEATEEIQNVHLFPGKIESNDWVNLETLYFQDVSDDATFDQFSPANSAFISQGEVVDAIVPSEVLPESFESLITTSTPTTTPEKTVEEISTTTEETQGEEAAAASEESGNLFDRIIDYFTGSEEQASSSEQSANVIDAVATSSTEIKTETVEVDTGIGEAKELIIEPEVDLGDSELLEQVTTTTEEILETELEETSTSTVGVIWNVIKGMFLNYTFATTTDGVVEDTFGDEFFVEEATTTQKVTNVDEEIGSSTTDVAMDVGTTTDDGQIDTSTTTEEYVDEVADSEVQVSQPAETESVEVDTIAPVLILNGNNPAYIPEGSSYSDLGAYIPAIEDQFLGIKTFVDGVEVNDVTLDTSSSTVYEIEYRATDASGNIGSVSRTVIVGEAEIEAPILSEDELLLASVFGPSEICVDGNENCLRKEILFSDFSIAGLLEDQVIENTQLRFSFGGQPHPRSLPNEEGLIVEYFHEGVWEQSGTLAINEEVSNALNGGYFLYALPIFEDWKGIDDLKVRIRYESASGYIGTIYLESLWIEVDTLGEGEEEELFEVEVGDSNVKYRDDLRRPRTSDILAESKLDFEADEYPEFTMRYYSQRSGFIQAVRKIFTDQEFKLADTKLIHPTLGEIDHKVVATYEQDGRWNMRFVDVPSNLHPGKYKVEFQMKEGGKVFTDTFEFYWGVLAVNPTKSIYTPGEDVEFHIGALTPTGNTICDASLELVITDPTGSSTSAMVTPSGRCDGNNITDVPDYTATTSVSDLGVHALRLIRYDVNGKEEYSIVDSFDVRESVPFVVERTGPTRIYPPAPYTMNLSITANEAFVGDVVEYLPKGFVVFDTDGALAESSDGIKLTWSVALDVGDRIDLTYSFDAPDISPYMYLLGPLQFIDHSYLPDLSLFEETSTSSDVTLEQVDQETGVIGFFKQMFSTKAVAQQVLPRERNAERKRRTFNREESNLPQIIFEEYRSWHIASDADSRALIFWDDDAYTPTGWTCVSCNPGDDYYQRFLRGSSSAATSTSFGSDTHTHTATGDVDPTGTGASGPSSGTGSTIAPNHTHTLTPDISSTSTLPEYRTLRILRSNAAGDPTEFPTGAILMFDTSVPSGWTRVGEQDGYFLRGESTSSSTSGSNTHTHTATGTIGASVGVTYGSAGASNTYSNSTHTHTVPATTTDSVDLRPPYIEVVFGKLDATTTPPISVIAMFDESAPAGWTSVSGASGDFNGKFVVGASSYGTTGGTTTHTHADITGHTSGGHVGTDAANASTGAVPDHTHPLNFTDFSYENNLPPYADVVVAKRIGTDPVYDITAFRWFVNEDAEPPTDFWPAGSGFVEENEVITDEDTPIKPNDVLRLRVAVGVTNATATASLVEFKLQYATGTICSAIGTWSDVGGAASTSAAWRGNTDNTSVSDGATLSSSTLSVTDDLETYEEENNSAFNPNQIDVGDDGEYDWVIENYNASSSSSYCFRMVESDGTAFTSYTQYPRLVTNDSPEAATLSAPFDNQAVASSSPWFEFKAFDDDGETLHYQIQIADNYAFSTTTVDSNSDDDDFYSNIISESDKAPYNNNETVRFKSTTTLSDNTTYWWRVRAKDPSGSNVYGAWSTPYSFTASSTVSVSTWYQDTEDQFDTDNHFGTEAIASDEISLISGSSTGTTTSSAISFSDGETQTANAWGEAWWIDDTSGGGSIVYRIEYFASTSVWELIPDADLPNNSTGLTDPVDLLDINTETYSTIRLRADFTTGASSPTLDSWAVVWGERVTVPEHGLPFDNEKFETTTPAFTFSSTDPQSEDLQYQLSYSTDNTFTSSTTVDSLLDAGFANRDDPTDVTDPYFSGDTIEYTIQTPLSASTTYWWRTRAKDPGGSNSWSFWSTAESFSTASSTETISQSTWFQDTTEQFETDTITGFRALNGTVEQAANVVTTYDFSGITNPSGTHVAREFEVDVADPTDPGANDDIDSLTTTGVSGGTPALRTSIAGYNLDNEALTADYTSLANSDDNRWTTVDPGAGDNAVFWARFEIAEDPANISQIDVTLEGYQNTGTDVAWLGIWLPSTTTPYWQELAHAQATADATYSGTITSNFAEYIDDDGYLYIIFFNEDTNDSLIIDYVSVDVTTVASTEGSIVGTSIDFDDGNGARWQEVSWNDYTPGSSDVTYQVEYLTSTSSWALIPDAALSGNSSGFTTSPVDIESLDKDTYNEIRLVGSLACAASLCPELQNWTVTWVPGISASGTAQAYDQVTDLTSGTVAIAVNGVRQYGKTAEIASGSWTITDIKAFEGDLITVFIDGATDDGEAVAVTTLATSTGNITGMELFERHLSIGSDQNSTTTNAQLGLFDQTASGDEDIFFEVNAGNDLIATTTGSGNNDVEIYIQTGDIYEPDSSSSGNVTTHDIEINGEFIADANTIRLSGSWDNNGTFTPDTSTVLLTATSTTETIDSTGATLAAFNDVTFGETAGTATWQLSSLLDVDGDVTIDYGTLSPVTSSSTFAGDLTINSNGSYTKGTATTTFDGSGTSAWTDNTAVKQDMGVIVIDGTPKTVQLGSDVALTDLTIEANDIFNVSNSDYDVTVYGNWTNNNTFTAQNGTVTFVGTATDYSIDPGSSSFYDLTFQADGGNFSLTPANVTVSNNLTFASGTVLMSSGTTTIVGSLVTTGGTFQNNNATVLFSSTGAETVTASTSEFYNVVFDGSGGSWVFNDTNATATNNFTVDDGTVTLPSGTLAVGNDLADRGGVIAPNSGTVRMYATDSGNIVQFGGSSLYNLDFDGSGGSWAVTDTNATTSQNLTIISGVPIFPSGTLAVGGSFTNSGGFDPNSGTVRMSAATTGFTVSTGGYEFYNLVFDATVGGWTLSGNASTTNNLDLLNADTFVADGTVEVLGQFNNAVGGASTTWTGSTLYLNSGNDYGINASTTNGDVYETLQIGVNTDIDMWNSSAATYTVDSSGSLYSQDHAGVDGDLYIWGTYTKSSGTDYWSYATDFDGFDLSGGNERQVNVRFADGATSTHSGATLEIVGSSTATTTIDAQGVNNYGVYLTGSSINAEHYSFDNMDAQGLVLSGSSTITSLADGEFYLDIDGGSLITVGPGVINTNALLQIERVLFATTTAITGSNVTATGSPTTFVWFRNHTGNLAGEDFDNDPTGNPGNVRWDDSNNTITVSGFVYADLSGTVSSACGAGTPVTVAVNGVPGAPVSCNGGDGSFTVNNVSFIGDPVLTVFLDTDGGERAVTVTRTPTLDIEDMILYENQVVVRHEGAPTMSIVELETYDFDDDTDIPFDAEIAGADTLTLDPNTQLHIWTGDTFIPGGDMTLDSGGSGDSEDGTLYVGTSSVLTLASGQSHSIGGSLIISTSSAFTVASSSLTFTATTTGKTIAATSTIDNITFNGSGGEWTIASSTTIAGDMTVTAGTVVGTANIGVSGGDVTGNGVIAMTGGTFSLYETGSLSGNSDWTFSSLTLGNGTLVATTTKSGTGTTTVSGVFTVSDNHVLDASNTVWDLSGSGTPFVISGTFDANESLFVYSGTGATTISTTTYNRLTLAASAGSPTYTIQSGTLLVDGDFTVGDGSNTVTVTANTNDPTITVSGTTTISQNGTLIASDTNEYTERTSFLNYGTFTNSNGTVVFNATTTGHVIQASTSPFFNVTIDSSSGGWTISGNATATNNFNLNNANDFTVSSGGSLAVSGQFSNGVGGAATTWTGSTLYLDSGTTYTVNTKTAGDDVYNVLSVGANTDIRMWNSSASTYDILGSSSLYSQDHSGTDGSLYIWGDYENTLLTDYWSYATDFDGTDISGGSERQVNVYLADNATSSVNGGTWNMVGDASASTTIQAQGSGTYALLVAGGTSDFQYYTIRDINEIGLQFTGVPTVTNLSSGDFLLEITDGSMMTVAGTVIDANSGKTFTNNRFATSSGVTDGFNVTADTVSVGVWRFTDYQGNYAGEDYDNDLGGDPGYIRWDDSNTLITISGTVYGDEGDNAIGNPPCDGTNVVQLRVAGGGTDQTSCNAATGAYSIGNISYTPGDVITVYLTTNAANARAVTITVDPLTNISNMDLYENRVIVRHEDSEPINVGDLAVFDSDDDPNIPFDAESSGLSVEAGTELHVWTGKTFQPGANITLNGDSGSEPDGTLHIGVNASFVATGTQSHSVAGSFEMDSGATFTAGTSTIDMTATTSGKIISATSSAFYNLTFSGSGGAWSFPPNILSVDNDFTISGGTVTLGSATTTVSGSFDNTGGSFVNSSGIVLLNATTSGHTIEAGGSDFSTLVLDGTGGEWTFQDLSATSSNFVMNNGSTTLPDNTFAIGGSFNVAGGTFTQNSGTLYMNSTGGEELQVGGSDFASLLVDGVGATISMIDTNATSVGTVYIADGTVIFPTNTFSIAGGLETSGAFTNSSGTVRFYGTTTGHTVDPNTSDFYNLTFDGYTGGWALSGDATTTNDFDLLNADTWSADGYLSVAGEFENLVGGASTTWTGSTLFLKSGTNYSINTKVEGGDQYETLRVGETSTSTDIRMWNSTSTIYELNGTSSIYSQDHDTTDGELYIFGEYELSSGTDYWSYATDFDGTDISGGSERQVTVRMADNSTTTISGGTLNIVGGSNTSTSTVTNQGSGIVGLVVTSGTFNADYFAMRNLSGNGLEITGPTVTISGIDNGDFELAVDGGAMFTTSSSTIDNNPTLVVDNTRFATSTGIASGYNMSRAEASANAWTFTNHYGNYDGESYDNDDGTLCGSFRWDDSVCLEVNQSTYRWRNDDGGEGVPDSEWFDTDWNERQRIQIADNAGTTSTNLPVQLNVTYDTDMLADFDDLRFTDSSGTTTIDFYLESYVASVSAVVWVEVPTLSANGTTDVFMYYDNATAVSSSTGTTTFSVFDDFEDGNISEYSGDTGLFEVSTSFNYVGTYGLDADDPDVALQTTDGIYRTDVTSNFGASSTVRYFQYVDATSDDEPCTLFGVQSPGSNNNNYAVCLDPFDDVVSLAKDVYSDDESGTSLDSTAVTFTTGWYEVVIDWLPDGSIDVEVFDDGSSFATVSATDTSYIVGGFGFSFWAQNGGWDYFTVRKYISSDPTVTFGLGQGSGGATWKAAENTAVNDQDPGENVRVRFTVNNTGPLITDQNFRLQISPKTGYAQCESVPSSSFGDMTLSASCDSDDFACMATSSNFLNQASTTQLLSVPDGSTFTYGQIVEDPSVETGDIDVANNEFTEIEYAFAFTDNASTTSYCLRTSDGGTELDSYSKVAEIGLRFTPLLTNYTLNAAQDITLTPGATTTVYATGTVIDLNGYDDLDYATTTIYRSGVGSTCSLDENNCYPVASTSCSFSACSGNSCELSCYADIQYHADPTDEGAYSGQEWLAEITAVDDAGYTDTQTTLGVDLLTLRALTSSSTIPYGDLAVNSDTNDYNATTTITNVGNDAIDISVEGTDLTFGASSIGVTNQLYATTTFDYGTCGTPPCTSLTGAASNLEVDLLKPTSTTTPITDDLYWGLFVPTGVAGATHEGTNTFTAIGD
jgi:hypothetical protein